MKTADTITGVEQIGGTVTNEQIMLNEITDTDRLDFLLKFFYVDDIGDEFYVPGVIIKSESLEDMLTWGSEAQIKRYNRCDNSDLRAIIDKAILIEYDKWLESHPPIKPT